MTVLAKKAFGIAEAPASAIFLHGVRRGVENVISVHE